MQILGFSDDIRSSGVRCDFFLAATGAPSVPIYLLADDRCHSQLNIPKNHYPWRTRDLLTHNRCHCRHWCPRRTKCCLLKALHSPFHPNHLGLRMCSVIVTCTSLQQANDRENLDLRFMIFISQQRSGIPEGRFVRSAVTLVFSWLSGVK